MKSDPIIKAASLAVLSSSKLDIYAYVHARVHDMYTSAIFTQQTLAIRSFENCIFEQSFFVGTDLQGSGNEDLKQVWNLSDLEWGWRHRPSYEIKLFSEPLPSQCVHSRLLNIHVLHLFAINYV